MKAAVISQNSTSSQWTIEEMKKYFDEVDNINLKEVEINFSGKKSEVLYRGEPLKKYDCIFAKGSFRYAPLLRSITTILQKEAYMPLTPSAYTIGHDKLLTQLEMQQKNIPMPRTYQSATIPAAKKIIEKMNYPIIMKFPQGTQGKGIMFADSYASASSVLDALSALNQPFLIQEYVETGGTDIRAIVVGEKVVAAMKRRADIKEKRANVHTGAVGEAVELDALTKKVAIDAAKAIGAETCGVDILESTKGPVVIEVNLSPGLQGITEATKINVAEHIAKYLAKRSQEKEANKKTSDGARIMENIDVNKKQELITNLDLRGVRILLPEVVTQITKFNETDDVQISAEKNKVTLKKLNIE